MSIMADLKGSKTEKNLAFAFAGESQARNKYTYFASKAKKEGYVQISQIFEETAFNEKEHAKIWFKILEGGDIKSTEENLVAAAAGEHEEWTDMYKNFADIEKEHEERYNTLLKNLKEGKVFKKDKEIVWICANCGHVYVGEEAPEKCPVCAHPQAYFQEKADNFQ